MRNLKNNIKIEPDTSSQFSGLYIVSERAPNNPGHDFHRITQALNTLLKQKQPKTFDCLWVEQHAGDLYKYI
jgi:hypothetical protein